MIFFSRMKRGRGIENQRESKKKKEAKLYKTEYLSGFRRAAQGPYHPPPQAAIDQVQINKATKNPAEPLPPRVTNKYRGGNKKRKYIMAPEHLLDEEVAGGDVGGADVGVADDGVADDGVANVAGADVALDMHITDKKPVDTSYPILNHQERFSTEHKTNDSNLMTDQALFEKHVLNHHEKWRYPYRPSTKENLRHFKIDGKLTEKNLEGMRDLLSQDALMHLGRIESVTKRGQDRKNEWYNLMWLEYGKMKNGQPNNFEEMLLNLNDFDGFTIKSDQDYLEGAHRETLAVPRRATQIMNPITNEWIVDLYKKTSAKELLVGAKGTEEEYKYLLFPNKG